MEIAQNLNISQSVSSRAMRCFLNTGSIDKQPGQRQPTTASKDQFLSLSVRKFKVKEIRFRTFRLPHKLKLVILLLHKGLPSMDCMQENQ